MAGLMTIVMHMTAVKNSHSYWRLRHTMTTATESQNELLTG